MAFVFGRAFHSQPPEYFIQSILHEFGSFELRCDGVETALMNNALVGRLSSVYEEQTNWEVDPFHIFRWVLFSMAYGIDAALRRARRDGREEWREIERIGRREALASMPGDLQSLISELAHPEKDSDLESDIEQWASGLGVLNKCGFCGTRTVDPGAFADAVVRHFRVRSPTAEAVRERVRLLVCESAVEQGSWGNSSVCSYCDNALNKDD